MTSWVVVYHDEDEGKMKLVTVQARNLMEAVKQVRFLYAWLPLDHITSVTKS